MIENMGLSVYRNGLVYYLVKHRGYDKFEVSRKDVPAISTIGKDPGVLMSQLDTLIQKSVFVETVDLRQA